MFVCVHFLTSGYNSLFICRFGNALKSFKKKKELLLDFYQMIYLPFQLCLVATRYGYWFWIARHQGCFSSLLHRQHFAELLIVASWLLHLRLQHWAYSFECLRNWLHCYLVGWYSLQLCLCERRGSGLGLALCLSRVDWSIPIASSLCWFLPSLLRYFLPQSCQMYDRYQCILYRLSQLTIWFNSCGLPWPQLRFGETRHRSVQHDWSWLELPWCPFLGDVRPWISPMVPGQASCLPVVYCRFWPRIAESTWGEGETGSEGLPSSCAAGATTLCFRGHQRTLVTLPHGCQSSQSQT